MPQLCVGCIAQAQARALCCKCVLLESPLKSYCPLAVSPPESLLKAARTCASTWEVVLPLCNHPRHCQCPCPWHPHHRTGHHLPMQLFAATLLRLFVMATNPAANHICPLTSSTASAADDSGVSALTYTGLKETKNGSFDQPVGKGQAQPPGLSPRVSEHCYNIALLQVWFFQQRREMQGTQFTKLKNTTWPRERFCPSRITFSDV